MQKTNQTTISTLFSRFAVAVTEFEDTKPFEFYTVLYNSAKLSSLSPLKVSGTFGTILEENMRVKVDSFLDDSHWYLYYETLASNSWTIEEMENQESVENFILNAYDNGIAEIHVFHDGEIQEYTLGRILEDGRRIELEGWDEIGDAIVYWGDTDFDELDENDNTDTLF